MSVAPYLLFEGGRNGSGFEYWVVSGRRDNHVAADGCWLRGLSRKHGVPQYDRRISSVPGSCRASNQFGCIRMGAVHLYAKSTPRQLVTSVVWCLGSFVFCTLLRVLKVI